MLLELQDVARLFGTVRAVDGVTLAVADGETVGLVGESGCGKSTTGRMAAGLITPSSGQVCYQGRELFSQLRAVRREIQMIFQDPFASLNPRFTIEQTLREPRRIHGLPPDVAPLLEQVGLPLEHARRYPHQLSGGQRQRVGIARALACQPRLIVADEPVSALDVSIQAQVVNLLSDLQRSLGLAMLFISHDITVVRHISHRIAVMYLGQIVESGPAADVVRQPKHPYTQALIAAMPRLVPGQAPATVLKGDLPSPSAPPPGCRFHTRCPLAQERCRLEPPALRPIGEQQVACHFAA
ncbi:MAG: ABC transporter ATP-binding protein [Candidatus Xenobia bacterium]